MQLRRTSTRGGPAARWTLRGACGALAFSALAAGSAHAATINVPADHATIAAAIAAANPAGGDVIVVAAGAYDENVVINKPLVLRGPNAGTAGYGTRVPEATISPAAGLPINVQADGVAIEGFEITAPGHQYAILGNGRSDLTIDDNHIHSVNSTGALNTNTHAIQYTVDNAPAAPTNLVITDNRIREVGRPTLTGFSASAIGILQSTTTGSLTGVTIARNIINDVEVSSAPWPTGKIAYGIQLNVGGNASFLTNGAVIDAQISDNAITGLSGHIATAIALEGNTPNAVVSGNYVALLSATKDANRAGGGYDLQGLKFENNRSVSTVTVEENAFDVFSFSHSAGGPGAGYAVANYVPVGLSHVDGVTGPATLSCNWLGSHVAADLADTDIATAKLFTKEGAVIDAAPFLDTFFDTSGDIGYQPGPGACGGEGPISNPNQGKTYLSLQAAILDADPGDTIDAGPGPITGSFVIDRPLTLQGESTRRALTPIVGAPGQPVFTVMSDGVTIDSFDMTGTIGVLSSGYSDLAVTNNEITADAGAIFVLEATTAAASTITLTGNDIDLTDQVQGTDPTIGIFLVDITGTDAAVVSGNTINGPFYGYLVNGVDTDATTTISSSTVTGAMQGLAVVNTVGGPLAPTDLDVDGLAVNSFAGDYTGNPALEPFNFHAGVYTFTAGATTDLATEGITLDISNSSVDGTDTVTQGSAGMLFADFSGNASPVQAITVTDSLVASNANRGIDARAAVDVSVSGSTLQNNGVGAFGTDGNDGYTVLARNGAAVTVTGCEISLPTADSATDVVAFQTGNAPASTITANNNTIDLNDDLNTSSVFGTRTGTGTIDATCNWWGTADAASIDPFIAGASTYIPFLATNDIITPVCTGGLPVVNITQGEGYTTIQAAIDDADPGDTITVEAGTYAENLVIPVGVTLQGPNAGLAGYDGARDPEATISPAAGLPINVQADGVTIQGFEITAPGHQYAILGNSRSGLTIDDNHIHSVNSAGALNTNTHAIQYTVGNTPAAPVNLAITDNLIQEVGRPTLTGFSASAIGILQSTTTGTLTGVTIARNVIDDVEVNNSPWPTGKIAYGIQLNVGGNASFLTNGVIANALIADNVVSNLSGHIATGIALEGNTPGAVVSGNSVSSLSGTKDANRAGGGYDLQGLKFENNAFVGTITVDENLFDVGSFNHSVGGPGAGYAVANYVPDSISGPPILTDNYLGSGDPLEIADNPGLTGNLLAKDGATIEVPSYLTSPVDDDPAPGFQPTASSETQRPIYIDGSDRLFASIQDAIDGAEEDDTVVVESGTYEGALLIDKGITLQGDGDPVLTAAITRRTTGNVINVVASGVTIDGFVINVDTSATSVGVNFQTAGALTDLTVTNNTFVLVGAPVAGAATGQVGFGTDSAAIVINDGDGDFPLFNISGNVIGSPAAPFDRAVFTRQAHGMFASNEIYGDFHDAVFQFVSGGALDVIGNDFNGWGSDGFKGAQLDFTEPNAAGGVSITVSGNTFSPQAGVSPFRGQAHVRSIMFKNKGAGEPPILVTGNTFNVREEGILVANTARPAILGNDFLAAAGDTDFRHIVVSNKVPTGGTPTGQTTSVDIRGNDFQGGIPSGGVAIEFRDHNNGATPEFENINVGGAAADANSFSTALAYYYYLDNQTGASTGSALPGYSILGITPMSPFALGIDASENLYDGTLPAAMTPAEQAATLLRTFDQASDPALGIVDYGFAPPAVVYVDDDYSSATFGDALMFGATPVVFGIDAFETIGEGLDAVADAGTVNVGSGSYPEINTIDRTVTLQGVDLGGGLPEVTNPPAPGVPTLLVVDAAEDVLIDSLAFDVDFTFIGQAIRTQGDCSGLVVSNNEIVARRSAGIVAFGTRHLVSINQQVGPGHVGGGWGPFTVSGNAISTVDPVNALPRAAVLAEVAAGTISGNSLQGFYSALLRFNTGATPGGTLVVDGNTMTIGQLQVTEPNPNLASVSITNNDFLPLAPGLPSIQLQNNPQDKPTLISGNDFLGHAQGIYFQNYPNVAVVGNTFDSAVAGAVHILLNNKSISSNSGSLPPVTMLDATFTDNIFNSSAAGQRAFELRNHNSTGAAFSTIVVGGAGDENSFSTGLAHYFYLNDDTFADSTTVAGTYPEYALAPTSATTGAPYAGGLDATANLFDGVSPSAMTPAEAAATLARTFDQRTNPALGFVDYGFAAPVAVYVDIALAGSNPGDPVTYAATDPEEVTGLFFGVDAFDNIADGVDAVFSGGTVNVADGSYVLPSDVAVLQPMTITGQSEANVVLSPAAPGGEAFDIEADNVTIRRMTISGAFGIAVAAVDVAGIEDLLLEDLTITGYTNRGISVAILSSTVNDCTIDGGTFGVVATGGGSHAFTNNDVSGAFGGLVSTTDAVMTGNVISGCSAAIFMAGNNFPDGSLVTIQGNTITDINAGGVGMNLVNIAPGSLVGGALLDGNTITAGPNSETLGMLVQYSVGPAIVGNNIAMQGDGTGVYLYHNEDSSDPVVLSGNVITSTGSSSVLGYDGSGIVLIDDGSPLGDEDGSTYALLAGNSISGFVRGINLQRVGTAPAGGRELVAIIGFPSPGASNDISGCDVGILVHEVDGDANGGRRAQAAILDNATTISGNVIGIDVDGGYAVIDGNSIVDNGTGIRVTNDGSAEIDGNNFDGATDNTIDIATTATAGAMTVGDTTPNALAGDDASSGFFLHEASFDVDATNNLFPEVLAGLASTATVVERANLEAQTTDVAENAAYGDVFFGNVDLFVDLTATLGLDNGASWTDAFLTIGQAITAAADGDAIWVANGVYAESLSIAAKDLSVYGGFEGLDGAQEASLALRNGNRNITMVRPSAGSRGVHVTGDCETLLDSLVIADAAAAPGDSGAGILYDNVSGLHSLSRVYITGNVVDGGEGGGGIFIDGGDAGFDLERLIVVNNAAAGGGPLRSGSAAVGGGIYVANATGPVEVTESYIVGNVSGADGGGLAVAGGSGFRGANLLVAGNVADGEGAGILLDATTSALLAHLSVADNQSLDGASLDALNGATATILNSLFARGAAAAIAEDSDASNIAMDTNLFWNDELPWVAFRDFTGSPTDYDEGADANILGNVTGNIGSGIAADDPLLRVDTLDALVPGYTGTWASVSYNALTGVSTLTSSTPGAFPANIRFERFIDADTLGGDAWAVVAGNTSDSVQLLGDYTSRVAPGDSYKVWSWVSVNAAASVVDVGIDPTTAWGAAIAVDVFGSTRPVNDYDIGAYELQAEPLFVELESFTASGNRGSALLVQWSTSSEIDNAGFHLYRSTSDGIVRLTDVLIAPTGDEFNGASYRFMDTTLPRGWTEVPYYFLEDVDLYGVSTIHGPADVLLNEPPAVTSPGVQLPPQHISPVRPGGRDRQ